MPEYKQGFRADNDDSSAVNRFAPDSVSEIPDEILTNPSLLFLYHRIEQILGIKAGSESLLNLNDYLEGKNGASFIENPAAYERMLASSGQIYEIAKFLTVNETYFFREPAHFEFLAGLTGEYENLGRPVQILCAAVSIGCEAYSAAMLLDHYQKKGCNFDFSIDAFDVNIQAIETAKAARYTSNALRTDGSSLRYILDSCLIPDGGEYIVAQNIRRKVNFFPHNIMRGLDKQYDIIFFRNSLIYFSQKNRLFVINTLADSLLNNGLLFSGASETASVKHPHLVSCYKSNIFYFRKINNPAASSNLRFGGVLNPSARIKSSDTVNNVSAGELRAANPALREKDLSESQSKVNIAENKPSAAQKPNVKNNTQYFKGADCGEIADILKTEEGKQNAETVIKLLDENVPRTESSSQTGSISGGITGSRLAACALYFLNTEKFEYADRIISTLEKNCSDTYTNFLRGEYYFLLGITEEAEKKYNEAAIKNKYFWPAFYRMAHLAADGNRTRYEYKIKKTIESIELPQNSVSEHSYECFMGGFSSDYFRGILEKKLT